MALTYWRTRKQPLRAEEVDENFDTLDQRLALLEKEMAQKTCNLASIRLQGSMLYFEGTHGVQFPPISIPLLLWKPRGPWKPHTGYNTMDVVYHEKGLYVCEHAHSSEEIWNTDHWKLHWQQIFSLVEAT